MRGTFLGSITLAAALLVTPAHGEDPVRGPYGVHRVGIGIWKASFSPDGSRLVATRGSGGLDIIQIANRARARLTVSGKDPDWSPDGRLIAVVDSVADGAEIETVILIDAAGGSPRRMVRGDSRSGEPTARPSIPTIRTSCSLIKRIQSRVKAPRIRGVPSSETVGRLCRPRRQ
jgi:Tol biopolymer transport system component